jgi:arsenate reductase-like glutaredoxin family protein
MRTPVADEEARVRSPCAGRNEDEGLKAEAEAAIAAIRATRSMVRRPILTSKKAALLIKAGRAEGL